MMSIGDVGQRSAYNIRTGSRNDRYGQLELMGASGGWFCRFELEALRVRRKIRTSPSR